MEGLKDLLAPKTLHWFSYVANVFWILLGIILSAIFLDIENSEPRFDFRCGSNGDKELIRGKCYEQYDKQYNKFPVYGFVIINFLVTASVCGIYSQAVKSKVEELEDNPRNPDLGQTSRKKLFKAYCLQLLARFVLGIFFLVLQTKVLYPFNFPSNFNCNLTRDGKFSDITASASRNETQTQTSYECHNQRAAKKTVWANAVIVVTAAFALLVVIESLYMLLCRARKVSFRAFTEDQKFHKCYLSSNKPTDEQVPRKTEGSERDPLRPYPGEGERLEEYPKPGEDSQRTIPGDSFGAEKQKTLAAGRPGIGKTMFSTKILRNPASENLFPMATRNDGDVQDKGRGLWDALKDKKIDRVDRISIIGKLLKNGAPVNFREPDRQVGNLKFINKVSVVIICRGITPHSYLRKKKQESARKSYPAHRQSNSIVPSRRIIAISLFIHDGGKL